MFEFLKLKTTFIFYFLIVLTPSFQSWASDCDVSLRKGVLSHGEHFADLILTGNSVDFVDIVRETISEIANGRISFLNEKFDGSPSIVLGYLGGEVGEGPFVAYKGEVNKKKKRQQWVQSRKDAHEIYKGKPELAHLYAHLAEKVLVKMRELEERYGDYVFQGDLLFSPGSRVELEGLIRFQPNTIEYTVSRESPHYEEVSRASIGLVIHTVGKRVIQDGRVRVEPGVPLSVLESWVSEWKDFSDVYIMNPFRRDVTLDQLDIEDVRIKNIAFLTTEIEKFSEFSDGFWTFWGGVLAQFRIFLNSQLKGGKKGGVYLLARSGKSINTTDVATSFLLWLEKRRQEERISIRAYDRIVKGMKKYEDDFVLMIERYHRANRIVVLLLELIAESVGSLLGGGDVEGYLLGTDARVVKLVDRLEFTIRNNARREALAFHRNPFEHWLPGAAFVVMKGQPVQPGHIAMIREAIRIHNGPLIVLASDKEPVLDAGNWKALGVAAKKGDLARGSFTHVFDRGLRAEIFEVFLGTHAVPIVFVNPQVFWKYVAEANSENKEGRIFLVVGSKEVEENRYTRRLEKLGNVVELLVIDMQNEGLSATLVRNAVASGDRRFLSKVYGELPEEVRMRLIDQLIDQWGTVSGRVDQILDKN